MVDLKLRPSKPPKMCHEVRMSAHFTLHGKKAVFLSKFAKNKNHNIILSCKTNTQGPCRCYSEYLKRNVIFPFYANGVFKRILRVAILTLY